MQSHNPEFPMGTNFNFSNENLLSPTSGNDPVTPLPPGNSFLLLDGSNFLLLGGTNFLLLT